MVLNPSANNVNREHEILPLGFRIVPTDDGPNKISLVTDVTKELKMIITNGRFDTINERLHGGFRQTATGCYEVLNGDDDRIKAGADRIKKYTRVLIEKGLTPVDWTAVKCEVVLLALYKRNAETENLDYKGLAVYAEKNDAGRELLEKLRAKPIQSNVLNNDAAFVNEPIVTRADEKPKRAKK
jgi:hypothetical protein